MSQELKACPFCGSDGEIIQRSNVMSKWKWSFDCRSTTCGACGPVEANMAEAIAAWNHRAPDPLLEEAERALEPFVSGAEHTMIFLRTREKMHPAGQGLYREDVERARATLSKIQAQREG